MTFDKSKWAKVDVGYPYGAPQVFGYHNESDSLTTIQGSGYFDNVTADLKQYDLILAMGTNGYGNVFQVSSATGASTVTVRFYNQVTQKIGGAGQLTTVGGSATEAFTISGIADTEFPFLQMSNNGTNDVTILEARVSAANTLTVVFSGDPGNDAIFNYLVIGDFV